MNQEKKKPATWDVKETECFLALIKELQVTTLMDGKKFRTSEIFKKVEEAFKDKGYNKTHTQLLEKFKAMKKRFKSTVQALSVSGVGTDDKVKCPYFDELNEIFGHRPIVNLSGIDSIQPENLDYETSGYCASDTEISVSKYDESQSEKFVKNSSRSSLSPVTSICQKRSSSDTLYSSSMSPISNCLSEDSRDTLPSFNLHEFDESDKPSTSKKRKICETPTSRSREGPRSGLKNIMQNFAEKIMESQEKLITKTIEEQRKLDNDIFDRYNNILLQQTQMLITGMQNLSSPFPKNYQPFQQFPGISTTMPPMSPMFTETLLHQPCSVQPTVSRQNDKSTAYPCTLYETQTRLKSNQTKKASPKFTTKPPLNSNQSKTTFEQLQNSSTSFHTSIRSQGETLSCPEVEDDIEYENIEYLDKVESD